jgi:hypothetical protein
MSLCPAPVPYLVGIRKMKELIKEMQVTKVTAPIIVSFHTTDTIKKKVPETLGEQLPVRHPDQCKSLSGSFTDRGLFRTNYCNKCVESNVPTEAFEQL